VVEYGANLRVVERDLFGQGQTETSVGWVSAIGEYVPEVDPPSSYPFTGAEIAPLGHPKRVEGRDVET
jgi:hypothetical protein